MPFCSADPPGLPEPPRAWCLPVCVRLSECLQGLQGPPQVLVQVAAALLQPSLDERSRYAVQQRCVVRATMFDDQLQHTTQQKQGMVVVVWPLYTSVHT